VSAARAQAQTQVVRALARWKAVLGTAGDAGGDRAASVYTYIP